MSRNILQADESKQTLHFEPELDNPYFFVNGLEDDCVRMRYDKRNSILYFEWLRPVAFHEFKRAYLQALQLAGNYGLTRWFIKKTCRGPMSTEEMSWIYNVFLHEFSHVLGPNNLAAVYLTENSYKEQVFEYNSIPASVNHDFVEINLFTSEEEAWHWLTSHEPKRLS